MIDPAPPAADPAPIADPAPPPAAPPPADPVDPPAPAAPAPPTAPPIGADGSLAEGWFLSLGDEFATHAADLGKHKNLRSLIQELHYYRKAGVEYPGDGADPKGVERFRRAAGVPEAPEGYGLTAEAVGLPEGVPFDSELAEAVTKAAHASHTPPAALHAMARTFNDVFTKRAAEAEAAAMAQRKAAQDALVAEWRGNFETNAATVRHVAGRLAETAGVEPEAVAELANNPAFARVMLQVSKLTAEDRTATPTGFGDLKSPAQKIADIKAGNDPHWSPKFHSTSERERLEAYNHIKRLREEAEQ